MTHTTTEQKIAQLVLDTGLSLSTVRRWWRGDRVRERTSRTLHEAAKARKIRRPGRDA